MPEREPSEGELRLRLDRLSASLDRETKEQQAAAGPSPQVNNVGLVFRFASEFVAGVLVGGLIGWGLDWAFGSSPVFLIVFLLVGFGAALTNMVRVAKAAQARTPLGNDLPDGGKESDGSEDDD